MTTDTDPARHDRRRHRRFAVEFTLKYKLRSGVSGHGQAANMSSSGLLFRCGVELPVGELIEVILTWPLAAEGGQPLVLRVAGIVVRSDHRGTALSISKRGFHTTGRPPGNG